MIYQKTFINNSQISGIQAQTMNQWNIKVEEATPSILIFGMVNQIPRTEDLRNKKTPHMRDKVGWVRKIMAVTTSPLICKKSYFFFFAESI
jgi:hypothetical protein